MLTRIRFCALAPVLFLAACSGGPSETDIQDALQRQAAQIPFIKTDISKVQKHKCESADAGRYRCAFTATVKAAGVETTSDASQLLEKMGDHWAIVGN